MFSSGIMTKIKKDTFNITIKPENELANSYSVKIEDLIPVLHIFGFLFILSLLIFAIECVIKYLEKIIKLGNNQTKVI